MYIYELFIAFFCYLPKFSILQVCSSDRLLLAKIFNFGKYVRLTVCLCVCVSVSSSIQVTVFYISLPNLTKVCIYVT